MLSCTADKCGSDPIAMPQKLLSFGEAVVLADVRDRADTVRKDIETGVIPATHVVRRFQDARLGFPWFYVYTLAAVYSVDHLGKTLRQIAVDRVCRVTTDSPASHFFTSCIAHNDVMFWCGAAAAVSRVHTDPEPMNIQIGKFLNIDMVKVCSDVRPRVDNYAEGLNRIEKKKGVFGGEAVFKGTRLPVRHIGGMVDAGETIENIRDDYPNLSEADVKFAHLYFQAHPPIGRPRKGGETDSVVTDVG